MSNLLKGCYYVISIFYLIGFIHPIILLGLAMVPPPLIYMFETKFHNLSNLSIGDFQGVTRITVSFVALCFTTTNHHASSGVSGKDIWVVPCNIEPTKHTGKHATTTTTRTLNHALLYNGSVHIDLLPNIVQL